MQITRNSVETAAGPSEEYRAAPSFRPPTARGRYFVWTSRSGLSERSLNDPIGPSGGRRAAFRPNERWRAAAGRAEPIGGVRYPPYCVVAVAGGVASAAPASLRY